MPRYLLKLFIAGDDAKYRQAISTLHRLCTEHLKGECDLTVVDVSRHPELADEHCILATPTLIRVSPRPTQRVIGDLSSLEKLLPQLVLEETKPVANPETKRLRRTAK